MRTLLLIALLFSAGLACATLNPPSSTPSEPATKPKADATQHEKNTEPDKRGTKEFPAIIEISKSPVIQVETADRNEKRHDYSSSEWWLVYLTGTVAFITFFLALYTGKLYRATVDLGKDAKKTSIRQAGEMQQSLAIAKQSADAATKSATALAAAERPYIFVQVHVDGGLRVAVQGPGILPVSSSCELLTRNFGKTPAVLVKFRKEVKALDAPPESLDGVHETTIPEGGIVIAGGQFQEFTDVFWITAEQYGQVQGGNLTIYCYGVITYADILSPGMVLETGFCWRYDPIGNSWYLCPSKLNRRT